MVGFISSFKDCLHQSKTLLNISTCIVNSTFCMHSFTNSLYQLSILVTPPLTCTLMYVKTKTELVPSCDLINANLLFQVFHPRSHQMLFCCFKLLLIQFNFNSDSLTIVKLLLVEFQHWQWKLLFWICLKQTHKLLTTIIVIKCGQYFPSKCQNKFISCFLFVLSESFNKSPNFIIITQSQVFIGTARYTKWSRIIRIKQPTPIKISWHNNINRALDNLKSLARSK